MGGQYWMLGLSLKGRNDGWERTPNTLQPKMIHVRRCILVRRRVVIILDEVDDVRYGEHAWDAMGRESGKGV